MNIINYKSLLNYNTFKINVIAELFIEIQKESDILKKCVKISKKYYETEASGGVTLKNVKKIANTGVNRISVGEITHSVNALDIKLEI